MGQAKMINLKKTVIGTLVAMVGFGVASYFIYEKGYSDAKKDIKLSIESIRFNAQEEIRKEYETKVKNLTNAHNLERNGFLERMRELEQFKRNSGSLETCSSDRSRLAELAIRGERLLKRAESYLEAIIE